MSWKNDKRTLWILVPAVLGIWGFIAWRVLDGLQEPDLAVPVARKSIQLEEERPIRSLSLDYPDPFGKKSNSTNPKPTTTAAVGSNNKARPVAAVSKKPQKQEKPWPQVRYLGQIKNLTTGKHSAMLQLGIETEMVLMGSTWRELTVLRCEADSVQLRFEKEKRWIKK